MTKPGIENIHLADRLLNGARIALMTNPSGVDSRLKPTIDIINEQYNLTALLACEHGVRGCVPAGENVDSFTDPKSGVTVYSCYGKTTHLSKEILDCFDVLVYDIQDAGARFYTFIYSLADAMEDCAKAGKAVVVLDRPNPLGGVRVQGTLLDERFSSFVGRYEMPTRYALTVGEYALWLKDHLHLSIELFVVPMQGWTRSMKYAETGLFFVPPSPNLASLHTAEVYPGTCIFEGTNISEGRGTALPFELIGAPFIDGELLAKRMNSLCLTGYYFRDAYFTPVSSKHSGKLCSGVQIYTVDSEKTDAPLMGLCLMDEIRNLSGNDFEWNGLDENTGFYTIDRLLGTDAYRLCKTDGRNLIERHKSAIAAWSVEAAEFHLYR